MTRRWSSCPGQARPGNGFAAWTRCFAAAAALVAAGLVPAWGGDGATPAKKPAAPTGDRVSYAYDGAGRLVRQGLPDGRVREFGWDRSGNRTSVRTAASLWHVAAKRPSAGAWSFTVGADGTVRGAAIDATHGAADLAGTFAVADRTVTGTIELRAPGSGGVLTTFDLAGSTAAIDPKSGRAVALTLRAGSLDARAVRAATVGSGFGGAFRSAKNAAKTSAGKKAVGPTWIAPEGTRYGASVVDGGVRGTLFRDPAGLAHGVLEVDGATYVVSGKLKDGAKKVTLRTARGVSPALTLTLAR